MDVAQLQQLVIETTDGPLSALEAAKQLKACADRALESLEHGDTAKAQVFVEQGFSNLLAAFHYLNLDVTRVVQREQDRRKSRGEVNEERVILVFGDHAELRVDGELRGTIPLFSNEDYADLRQIAHLFKCRMEFSDHVQLDLFNALMAPKAS